MCSMHVYAVVVVYLLKALLLLQKYTLAMYARLLYKRSHDVTLCISVSVPQIIPTDSLCVSESKIVHHSDLSLLAWDIFLAHETCRWQLANFSRCLHRINQADVRIVAKHIVERVLTINQLKLVELHVLCCLLKIGLLRQNLVLQLLDKLSVLGPTRPAIVHTLQLDELLIKVPILLVHQTACISELSLQCLYLSHLLIDEFVHLLAE